MTIREMRNFKEEMVSAEKKVVEKFVTELLKEVETMATKEVKEKLEANPYVTGVSIHIDIEKEVFGTRWFLDENMDLVKSLVAKAVDSIKEDKGVLDLDYDLSFEGRKSANKMNIRVKGSARIIF